MRCSIPEFVSTFRECRCGEERFSALEFGDVPNTKVTPKYSADPIHNGDSSFKKEH